MNCVTHHYACDCREAKNRELLEALREAFRAIAFDDIDSVKMRHIALNKLHQVAEAINP